MKKVLVIFGVFVFAFAVLFVSIFNSSSVTYSLCKSSTQVVNGQKAPIIDYTLPFMGYVLPDSPFWKFKALRDKIWFGITTSHLRKAQLALLFADKRLAMAMDLFERGETEIATSTFTKGEKYLAIAMNEEEIARAEGTFVNDFISKLAVAALKHREVAEDLEKTAPEQARPIIIEMEIYSEDTFTRAKDALNIIGLPIPKNPFERN
jgi:hypothetical protein